MMYWYWISEADTAVWRPHTNDGQRICSRLLAGCSAGSCLCQWGIDSARV